jgi:preprotein translocase subunit SecE
MAVAVGAAYVSGKMLEATWNTLASWPAATAHVPFLLRYREDERPEFTMVAGLIIGVCFGVWLSRQSNVRRWADDVAGELAKVHWPNREIVQNGTLVVVIAGLFATIYVGLLDRFWVFVTTLVYGA